MIRTILVSLILFSTAIGFSYYLVGYDRGGQHYISRQREHRKSLRVGSRTGVYYGHGPYSSRGPRFGK
ncbi:MAG TPA: hypothetical protein PK200_05635 [Spirochaetota bacterium]|nr:hypothetical protein [Spirochaetota bacterium]HQO03622.1 hypothetical protein [Spirochaetota bacterium]HQP49639.1 hypothetical protein [Spirochaetota bacterium]